MQTVDPMKATGKPHSLWVSFAKFYEENEQLDDVSHEKCLNGYFGNYDLNDDLMLLSYATSKLYCPSHRLGPFLIRLPR